MMMNPISIPMQFTVDHPFRDSLTGMALFQGRVVAFEDLLNNKRQNIISSDSSYNKINSICEFICVSVCLVEENKLVNHQGFGISKLNLEIPGQGCSTHAERGVKSCL